MLSPRSPSDGSLSAGVVLGTPDTTPLVTGPAVWLPIYFQPDLISLIRIPCYLDTFLLLPSQVDNIFLLALQKNSTQIHISETTEVSRPFVQSVTESWA